MIYTVTFNPAIDYVVHTDAMQVGMVNRSRTEEIYYGGKGINVSMVLKELGLESRALPPILCICRRAFPASMSRSSPEKKRN